MAAKILRRRHVQDVTGLSRSTIYDMMSKGAFPRPMRLGLRAVGWAESEIDAWLEARMAERKA